MKPADRLKETDEYYLSMKLEIIRQMREKGIDVINLGIGSPDLMPASDVIDATATALKSDKMHGYASSRSTPELRNAISDFYSDVYKVKLDATTEILPLLGSKEGILFLSMAYLNPGDTVLVPNPGYPAYSSVAKLIGAKVLYYDLTEKNGWYPDFNKIEESDLSKAKLMWVNYPNMPTGTVASEKLFEKCISFGKRHRILVCNDNPYGLVLNQSDPLSILKFDPTFECLLELNSLSKSFNMAGWRIGMALGNRNVIKSLLQVKSNIDSGMFLPIQTGATKALKLSPEWHTERNRIYNQRRKIVFQMFDQLGFSYSTDQVGLFVWARVTDSIADAMKFVDQLLDEANVFFTPGQIFGSNGSRYVRASLCADESILKVALERIIQWKSAS